MTDLDVFEYRLADALTAYAIDAPVDVDPAQIARRVVGATSRRHTVIWRLEMPKGRAALILAIAAALVLASLLAIGAGSRLTRPQPPIDLRRPQPVVDVRRPQPVVETKPLGLQIPGELHGRWEAAVAVTSLPAGLYVIDFRSTQPATGPNGTPVEDVGTVAEVTRRAGVTGEFTVRFEGGCGPATYVVRHAPEDRIWFTRQADDCVDRQAFLTQQSWEFGSPFLEPRLGPFVAGETYDSGVFTEPFRFVMPIVDDTGDNTGLPGQFEYASPYVTASGLRFGGPWWSMYILDDLPINADLCDAASELLPDIPPTPDAVGAWLQRQRGVRVSEPVPVPVDGRTALRWDLAEVEPAPSCNGARLPAGGYFGYMTRAYAIPTGDDTILVVFGSDGVNWEAVKSAVDALVRSMDFA